METNAFLNWDEKKNFFIVKTKKAPMTDGPAPEVLRWGVDGAADRH